MIDQLIPKLLITIGKIRWNQIHGCIQTTALEDDIGEDEEDSEP
jgi:hypothetical protein